MSKKPETFMLRVDKGCLRPADRYTQQRMREKHYDFGDILSATLRKARNPQFHRLVHAFGQLCADNLDDFSGLNAHTVLKRIQLEGGIECDEMLLRTEDGMQFVHRTAKSLSYTDMDEGVFSEVFRLMCDFVRRKYWPTLTDDEIKTLSEIMADEEAA